MIRPPAARARPRRLGHGRILPLDRHDPWWLAANDDGDDARWPRPLRIAIFALGACASWALGAGAASYLVQFTAEIVRLLG